MARRMVGLLVTVVSMLLLATAGVAQADTTDIIQPQGETFDSGFQAITCVENEVPGAPPEGPMPKQCSPETPEVVFKVAGGHPPLGFTQYTIKHAPYTPLGGEQFLAPIESPILNRTIKTLRSDLPPGLTVNPEATGPRCPEASFYNKVGPEELIVPACDSDTIVGEQRVTLVTNKPNVEVNGNLIPLAGYVITPIPGGTKVPIYNLEPKKGEPARLGFVINAKIPVILETEVAWESDYHESFTIKLPNTAELTGLSTLISRLMSNGRAGDKTYLTNPTTCFDPNEAPYEKLYSTWFRAESYGQPNPSFPVGSTPVEAPLPKEGGKRLVQEGCESVPFEPSLATGVTTDEVDSPTGGTVEVSLPFDPDKEGDDQQSQSHMRKAVVTLPEGMGLNPTGSKNLVACSDAQFRKGQRIEANACPPESKVGTAVIESPPLHEPLVGDVYVGEQQSNDPESGDLFRILVEAKSEAEGIVVRLVGKVEADAQTGQLTGVFTDQITGPFAGKLPDGLPQVPFESVKISFDASKAVLTTPPTCTAAETVGEMEPWARPGTHETVVDSFTLSSVPGGGTCPTTLAERRFTPGFQAASTSSAAGAASPFQVRIARADGEQELKVVDLTMPPGLSGKLAGLEYCSEAAIAAAAQATGRATIAAPPCPNKSFLGTATVAAGSGSSPLSLPGNVYLGGPYKGAPLSLAVVTPAVSGPFDLGTVVVRVALFVEPESARIRPVSDPIPNVFGGVKLDIRTIDVDINRKGFMRNPTNCNANTVGGQILGGGANPADPAAFSSFPVSAPYQASDCNKLRFKPRFFTRLTGPTKRDGNPKLRAIIEAGNGEANIARTALTLPSSLFLDQSHIGTVCTRAQLASKTCPKNSVYGQAEARSPLLAGKLKGPVYLVANPNTELPNLLADLRGQVNVQLRGIISSKRGGLKTVFNNVPDVPVKKFILRMKGGKKSLLVNSRNTCKEPQRAVLNIKAQNGKKVKNNKFRLNIASCKGKKKK